MVKIVGAESVRFIVHVKPHASRIAIEKNGRFLTVRLTASPQNDLANHQLIEIIAKEIRIAKSCINIIKGRKSHNKLLEVNGITEKQLKDWRRNI